MVWPAGRSKNAPEVPSTVPSSGPRSRASNDPEVMLREIEAARHDAIQDRDAETMTQLRLAREKILEDHPDLRDRVHLEEHLNRAAHLSALYQHKTAELDRRRVVRDYGNKEYSHAERISDLASTHYDRAAAVANRLMAKGLFPSHAERPLSQSLQSRLGPIRLAAREAIEQRQKSGYNDTNPKVAIHGGPNGRGPFRVMVNGSYLTKGFSSLGRTEHTFRTKQAAERHVARVVQRMKATATEPRVTIHGHNGRDSNLGPFKVEVNGSFVKAGSSPAVARPATGTSHLPARTFKTRKAAEQHAATVVRRMKVGGNP